MFVSVVRISISGSSMCTVLETSSSCEVQEFNLNKVFTEKRSGCSSQNEAKKENAAKISWIREIQKIAKITSRFSSQTHAVP